MAMNLVQQGEDLQDFSDEALANELQTGQRGYLPVAVISEIERRTRDRQRYQQTMAAQQAEAPPVVEARLMEFMAQSQPSPEMGMAPEMAGMPPEMAAMPPQGIMAAQPEMAPMPAEAPAGIASMMPPQQMAEGGMVRRAQTGLSVAERNKRIFLQNFYPQAQRVAEQLNVPVDSILAQAALESQWGKKYKGSNVFGIKADPSWKGDTIDFTTQEVRGGQRGFETGRFRKYPTTDVAFEDYGRFLTENPRYKDVLGTGEDIELFAERMGQSGYATDPEYATKLSSISQNIRGLRSDLGIGVDRPTQSVIPEREQSFFERNFPKTLKGLQERREGFERFRGAQTAADRGAATREAGLAAGSAILTGTGELLFDNPAVDYVQGILGLAPLESDLQEVMVTGKKDLARQKELEGLSELSKGVTIESKKRKEPGIQEELLAALRTARGTSAQRADRLERKKKAELMLGLGELIGTATQRGDIARGLPTLSRRLRGVSERADEENLKNLMAQYTIAQDIEKSNLSFETLQIEKMKAQAALAKAISGGGSEQEITNLKNLLEAIAKAEEGMYGENKEVYESIFQRLQGIAGVGGPQGTTSAQSILSTYGRG